MTQSINILDGLQNEAAQGAVDGTHIYTVSD
jgi:hypothetical protein